MGLRAGAVGRGAAAAALLALAAGVVAVGGTQAAIEALPPLGDPCRLAVDDGEDIGLGRAEARSVTAVGGAAVRDQAPPEAVAAAVQQVLGGVAEVTADTAPAALARAGSQPSSAAADVVLGRRQAALTCRVDAPARSGQAAGPSGLTPRAERVRAALEASFGGQSLGGFAPGGVSTGHIDGSAHYDGRALDVFFRPVTTEGTADGWAVAHWAVAHATELDVTVVIYDRQIWSGQRSSQGWRDYEHPSGDTDNPILAHEDHVHVEVGR